MIVSSMGNDNNLIIFFYLLSQILKKFRLARSIPLNFDNNIFMIFRHNYDFVFNSLLILDVAFLVEVTVLPMH